MLLTIVPPETCNCAALRNATRHVTRIYDEALAPVGIGVNQYSILAKLQRFGPQNLNELAGQLVMDRSTLGHLVRPLQSRGLLTIEACERDARRRIIALTQAGASLVAEARPFWARAQHHFEQSFGAEEAQSFRAALLRATTLGDETPDVAEQP